MKKQGNEKVKKFLIIQPFLSYGGAEAVSVQLAYRLGHSGKDAVVVALYKDKRLPHLARRTKIVTIREPFSTFFSKSKLLLLFLGLPFLAFLALRNTNKNTALNPHNFTSLWAASLASLVNGTLIVWTVHNLPQTPFNRGILGVLFNPAIEFLNGLFARRCKQVVAVSEKVKRELKQKYQVNARLFYPAVDFEFWSLGVGKEIKKKYGLNGKFIILSVGRLKKEKNQELLLKVFAQVSRKIEDGALIIVGDGEELARLKELTKELKISSRVHFVGYQPPEALRDFYKAADLHLLPAFKTEGLNLTPLEALCSQTVSIVAQGSGIDQLLKKEEVGLVAKPTIESFSNRILKAINRRSEVVKMGKKGQAWVRNKLSWEKYVKKFKSLV